MKDHKHDQEDFTLKKIRYYQGTVDDFETFWKKKSEQGEAEECPETKACKEINANLNKAFEIVPVTPDDAVSEDEPKEAKKKKKKHDDEVNEGVLRNSIIRTSGTGTKRREDSIEYNPIDLGLPSGTLWCDRNVGATSPEDYGGYFYWGGTEDMTGKNCVPATCPYWNAKEHIFEKYNENDKKIVLEPEDDAAHVNMGGKWHMPTLEQLEELKEYTECEETKSNGIECVVFKSKVNSNSIVFPLAGFKNGDTIIDVNDYLALWSSTLASDSSLGARMLDFSYKINLDHSFIRYFGLPVRGVIDNK